MLNKKTLSLTLAVIVVALAMIMLSMIIWDKKIETTKERSETGVTKEVNKNKGVRWNELQKFKKEVSESLPGNFQQNEYTNELIPTEGYTILSSIFSNKKDKVVYFEFKKYDYNIMILNLETKETQKIFPSESEKARAYGACPGTYYPIAWSKNDKQIITGIGFIDPNYGSGCVPSFEAYTIDINSGELNDLATDEAIFLDNNLKVVYTDSSENSPDFCGPGGTKNHGSIKIRNIETGEEKTIIEEENSYYNLSEINNNSLTYTVKKVFTISGDEWPAGCSQFDESFPESEKIIKIN